VSFEEHAKGRSVAVGGDGPEVPVREMPHLLVVASGRQWVPRQ
jgi:hypothetical protein